MAGFCRAVGNRSRAIGLALWRSRTKTLGYLGVVVAAVQMGIAEGQHWPMLLLGALTVAIGHYNDIQQSRP
jgi:hypothetical protein